MLILTGKVQEMDVRCKWSMSLPVSGAEQDVSLLLESETEWTRLKVESLVPELFVIRLEPMTCTIFDEF